MNGLPPLDHLLRLSDDTGIIQHATYDVPNRATGYCTDDVARAFIVACLAARRPPPDRTLALRLGNVYLAFITDAQLPDGRFHNFMSYGRTWLDDVGTADANGRAIWALGFGMRYAPSLGWRSLCAERLVHALPHVGQLGFVRARAYAAIGLVHAYEATERSDAAIAAALRDLGEHFGAAYGKQRRPGWEWFERSMTYDNARLPEAALRIGLVLQDPVLLRIGAATLEHSIALTLEDGVYVPIGNDGWYTRDGLRARFDQQPLEAAAFVDAALVAAEIASGADASTPGEAGRFERLAQAGLVWFEGGNVLGLPLATPAGGCCDGLRADGVNANQGAESTLAYLAAAHTLAGVTAGGRPGVRAPVLELLAGGRMPP